MVLVSLYSSSELFLLWTKFFLKDESTERTEQGKIEVIAFLIASLGFSRSLDLIGFDQLLEVLSLFRYHGNQ